MCTEAAKFYPRGGWGSHSALNADEKRQNPLVSFFFFFNLFLFISFLLLATLVLTSWTAVLFYMLRVDEWTDVDRKRGTVTAGCMHQSNPTCTPGAHRAWTPEAVPAAFSQCHKWTATLTCSLNALLTVNHWKTRPYLKIIWPQKSAVNLTVAINGSRLFILPAKMVFVFLYHCFHASM